MATKKCSILLKNGMCFRTIMDNTYYSSLLNAVMADNILVSCYYYNSAIILFKEMCDFLDELHIEYSARGSNNSITIGSHKIRFISKHNETALLGFKGKVFYD